MGQAVHIFLLESMQGLGASVCCLLAACRLCGISATVSTPPQQNQKGTSWGKVEEEMEEKKPQPMSATMGTP